jgi:hypothetical protein
MATGRETIYVKQGDVGKTLFATLYRDDDVLDLTNATSVDLHIADKYNNLIVDETVTIVDASAGSVSYQWQAADLARVGDFLYEFEVTWNDSSIETYPNKKVGFDCKILRQIG